MTQSLSRLLAALKQEELENSSCTPLIERMMGVDVNPRFINNNLL
jgi:hypothetical protein